MNNEKILIKLRCLEVERIQRVAREQLAKLNKVYEMVAEVPHEIFKEALAHMIEAEKRVAEVRDWAQRP